MKLEDGKKYLLFDNIYNCHLIGIFIKRERGIGDLNYFKIVAICDKKRDTSYPYKPFLNDIYLYHRDEVIRELSDEEVMLEIL